MSYTVKVSNLSPQTTESNLKDFFSFCGKITSIQHDTAAHSAVIHFEKSSAAKTALMLNGGTLDGAVLNVTSDTVHPDQPEVHDEHVPTHEHDIDQSEKPRAGIVAEYLANGYVLSDSILQRAIEVDNKQGISKRFLNYFNTLDTRLGSHVVGPEKTISGKMQETLTDAQAKAKEIDERKGFSSTAEGYYRQALQHPIGKKIYEFYTSTTKQVVDIHEEAKRIAKHRQTQSGTSPGTDTVQPAAEASKEKTD